MVYIAFISWLLALAIIGRRLFLYSTGTRLAAEETFAPIDQILEQTISLERMFQSNLHQMGFGELSELAEKANAKKDYRKVVKYLEEALKREIPADHYIRIHVLLAEAYTALRDYMRALVVINKLILHFPREAVWLEQAVSIQLVAGHYEDAVRTVQQLLQLDPGRRDYLELLAKTYRKLKQHDKAREIYQDIHRSR
ncbi:MAG: tetratricopeptide repeat protein [Candidatus Abawacabacteria bacterium]|nr:tetratricopeptide repeat protein [Candidatus Abawacabacteria bacterium]